MRLSSTGQGLFEVNNHIIKLIDEFLDGLLRFITHIRDAECDPLDLAIATIDQDVVLST